MKKKLQDLVAGDYVYCTSKVSGFNEKISVASVNKRYITCVLFGKKNKFSKLTGKISNYGKSYNFILSLDKEVGDRNYIAKNLDYAEFTLGALKYSVLYNFVCKKSLKAFKDISNKIAELTGDLEKLEAHDREMDRNKK